MNKDFTTKSMNKILSADSNLQSKDVILAETTFWIKKIA